LPKTIWCNYLCKIKVLLKFRNHSVSGVKVQDAKIVAAMKAHNIQNLLTFNAKDFKRYANIKAVELKDV